MSLVVNDRVLETSTSTGTGTFTLAGAIAGFQAFSAVCSTGDTCFYMIEAIDASGIPTGAWESGLGTYSAANTLTRTTVSESSNSGATVSFAAGTKRVAITQISKQIKAVQHLAMPEFDMRVGATFTNGFWGGPSIVMPCDAIVTHVVIWATAAVPSAQITPAIYSVTGLYTMSTLLMQGPQVTGVTAGLNELPLTTPIFITRGTMVYAGTLLLSASIDIGTRTQSNFAYFSQGAAPAPTSPPTATYTNSAGWHSHWLRGMVTGG